MTHRLTLFLCIGFAFVAGTSLAGCGGSNEYVVSGTGSAAGADAEIEVEENDMGSKTVTIAVKHLPPPERVTEGATAYVVWFTAEDQPPQKVGRLQFDEDERSGKGGGTTPFEEFTILITAEETDQVTSPSKNVVIRQEAE